MHRKLPLFVLLLILIFSCKDQPAFKVEGMVPDEIFNGSVVYLVALDAPVTRIVDSTYVKNGGFSFSVRADSSIAKILRIPFKYPNAVEDLVVITEPGTIKVTLDEKSHGKGTRLNGILQQWKDDKHIYDSIQWSLFEGRDMNSLRKETVDSLLNTSKLLKEKFLTGVIGMIDENLNNGIGLLLFKIYFDQIPFEKRESIIKQTNGEYFRKDAQLKDITR